MPAISSFTSRMGFQQQPQLSLCSTQIRPRRTMIRQHDRPVSFAYSAHTSIRNHDKKSIKANWSRRSLHARGGASMSPSNSDSSSTGSHSICSFLSKVYTTYLNCIDKRPIITKSVTCGIISCIGDVLSQLVTAYSTATTQTLFPIHFNVLRCWAFFLTGTLFVGPYIHYWYQTLWTLGKYWQSKFQMSKVKQVLYLNVLDQTLGVLVFFPLYFYIYAWIEAACSWRVANLQGTTHHLIQELPSVLLMQYKIWPLANCINFMYVPESLRVLVSNLVAVLWNIYLCSKVG